MDDLTTPVFTGTSIGAMLLLAALGLTLTFGQMGVINMANGEFLMAGAYVAYITQVTAVHGLSLVLDPVGLRCRRAPRAAARGRRSSGGCTTGRSTRSWSPSGWPDPAAARPRHLRRARRPGPHPELDRGQHQGVRLRLASPALFTIALAVAAGRAQAVHEVQPVRPPHPRHRAEPRARRDGGHLDPRRRPGDVLHRLRPGRRRRRRHRLDLRHEPDARDRLHHPGVPGGGRRRRRAAQGHGDRRLGGRAWSQRSSPTGRAAAWRRSSPSPSS